MFDANYAPLISALTTLLVSSILLFSKLGGKITDVPNSRSLHVIPTPRIGGVGMVAGILSGWAAMLHAIPLWLISPFLMLFFLSLVDDVRGLSVRLRFAVHIIAAIYVAWGAGLFAIGFLGVAMVVLMMVWVINLYNFMDGADGLAGGMALFGFSMYGIAALIGNDFILAMMCFSVGAAALGFLYFNFAPARMFMGDAGSIPLGFLVAAISIAGWAKNLWPSWFPMMVFSPFVLDASVTLLKRLVRRERIWQAHREHYYQRIVQMGMGHRNTAIFEYILMLLVGASALIGLMHPESSFVLISIWCLIYFVAMAGFDYFWKISKRG